MNLSFSIPEWMLVLAWVSTTAVLAVTLAAYLLRRRTSALRHLFWLLALGAPLAALPLGWVHPRMAIPILPRASQQVAANLPLLAGRPSDQPSVSASVDQVSTIPLSRPASLPLPRSGFKLTGNLWFSIWLAGSVFLATRFFLSHLKLQKLVRNNSFPANEALLHQLGEATRPLGLTRPVRLLVSPLTPIPFCHGVFQPVINFPESWRDWDHERIQLCLSHELAHIVRHDLPTLLIGRLACMVCWFNPLVWFAVGKLRHEAEKAADDLVLGRGFDPAAYASALIALAECHQASSFSGSALALAMARRNRLSSRVGAILDGSQRRRAPGRGVVLTISLAALGMLVAGMIVRLTAAPPEGKATGLERDLVKLDSLKREAIGEMAYQAIKAGDIQTIGSFLQRGLNPNEDLDYGDPLLFQAVDDHQPGIVKLLLANGADSRATTSSGDTPAKRACWRGYKDIADMLTQAGVAMDARQYATGVGDVANLEAEDKKQPISVKEAKSLLYFAVASGHKNTFDWLWTKLGSLDATEKDKLLGDFFENAGRWGQPEMLRHLRDLGASLEKHGAKALVSAASRNYLEATKYMLEAGVSPNSAPGKENLILRNAAGEGYLEMVRLLLDHGADINAGTPESFTPLGWAAYCGKEDVCLLLLERGADASIVDSTGGNAAWQAAGGEHCPKALEVMLKQGVKVSGTDGRGRTIFNAMMNFVPPRPGESAFLSRVYSAPEMEEYDMRERRVVELLAAAGLDCKGQEGSETPLMSALDSGHNAAARALLDHGADFSIKDKDGNSAVYYLIERNWGGPPPPDLVESFFRRGGDPNSEIHSPNAQPPTSYSLLAAAVGHAGTRENIAGSRRVVQMLIEHGARFPKTPDEKIQALLQAAAAGSVARIQEAVHQGAPVNAADGEGWDALAVSLAMDHEDCANWLLANGAVPSSRKIKPRHDVLTFAVEHDRTALVDALIAKGAKPNGSDWGLSFAIRQGNLHILEALLQAGVDPKTVANATETFNGKTYVMHGMLPLYLCVDRGQVEMAKVLLDRGADPDPVNLDHGRNLVWWAVSGNQSQILQALLDHGADPTRKDEYGESALSLARKSHPALVPMLEDADLAADARDCAALTRKAESIVIPRADFQAVPLSDALETLRQEAARLDIAEPDPKQRGINIFLKLPAPVKPTTAPSTTEPNAPALPAGSPSGAPLATAPGQPITLSRDHRSLLEVLRGIAGQAGLKIKVERFAVSLVPLTEQTEKFLTAQFRVAPSVFGASAPTGTSNNGALLARVDVASWLKDRGIPSLPGTSATYLSGSQKLVVRNTEKNINRLKVFLPSASVPPFLAVKVNLVERQPEGEKTLARPTLFIESGKQGIIQSGKFEYDVTPTLLDDGTVEIRAILSERDGEKTRSLAEQRTRTELGRTAEVQTNGFTFQTETSLATSEQMRKLRAADAQLTTPSKLSPSE